MPSEKSEHSEAFATDSLLTVQEVADMCKVPVSWIYERTRRRGPSRLPHVRLGKYLRFDLNKIREWLQKNTEE
jgi:excisionase family DNA binding protein